MILIADSSALITLAIIDKLDLLEKLFGEVYVPRAVYNEIYKKDKNESIKLANYCKDRVLDIKSNTNFNISLGKGESEAIALYNEKNADFYFATIKKLKNLLKVLELELLEFRSFNQS